MTMVKVVLPGGAFDDCCPARAPAKLRLWIAVDRAVPIAHRMDGAIGFIQ
jgi:hypothetical protein